MAKKVFGARLWGMSGEARQEAAALIAEGFRVWPISRRTLTPAKAGFARANGPDVCAAADEFTDATEVGVLCGPCPAAGPGARFVCVDYDGPVPVEARVGGGPTLTSKQGAHAWYRVPPDVTGFRQTQSVRYGDAPGGAWAVDTRDFGGYARETKNGEPLWDGPPSAAWPRDLTQAEVDQLFGPVVETAAPDAPTWDPPAKRTVPSQAAVAAFVLRVVANPNGTNTCFGAVGSCLASWGWDNDEIASALTAWFAGTVDLPGRHLASALRAADTRRDGAGAVPGFPKLAELGVAFEPESTGADDGLWDLLSAEPGLRGAAPAPPAADDDGWVTAATVAAWDPPPIPWLCEALGLAPGAPGLITGYGGSGKTTFVQHLAIAVATPGVRLLAEFPVRHGSVTHLDYEQGQDLTMRRYQRLGLTAEAQLRFTSAPKGALGPADDREARLWLAKACIGQALVVVDSLVAGIGGALEDENAAGIREPLDFLGRVSGATGATVLVIHHSKKDRQNGRISARGSSAITDAVSLHLTYEKDDNAGPKSPPVLSVQKLRHEAPAKFAVWEPFEVKTVPRGFPADQGYTLVRGGDASDLAEARVEQAAEEIVALLITGWTGPVKDLRAELKRKGEDVSAAVKRLKDSGAVVSGPNGLSLAAPK